MIQGRRASEVEAPTSIWLDPPSAEEAKDLPIVPQAMKSGAFTVQGFPGVAHRGALRVRGVDQPPRQGFVTPAPSSPESLAEPSPRGPAKPRSPEAAKAWCPARAFATLTVATLAAGASGAGSHPAVPEPSPLTSPPGGVGGSPTGRPVLPRWAHPTSPAPGDGGNQSTRSASEASTPRWGSRGRAPSPPDCYQPEDGDSHSRHGQRHILVHGHGCRGPEFGHGSPHPPGSQVEGRLPQGGESRN